MILVDTYQLTKHNAVHKADDSS